MKRESKDPVPAKADRPHSRITEDRVEDLLDIAAAVFAERGFDGASVNEMAKRANASKGTYYRRYPSKEELLMAVMGRRVEGLENELSSISANDNLEVALTEFATRILNVVLSEPMLATYRVVTMESRRFPGLGKAYFDNGVGKILRFLTSYFVQMTKVGHLKVEHPEISAELFIDSIVGIPRMKAALGLSVLGKKDRTDRIKVAVQTFLRAHSR